MTYALFALAVVLGTLAITAPTLRGLRLRPILLAAAALTVLTVVFDNVLVGVGIVAYDEDRILGLRMPIAPIEDLSYTLAAVLLVPAVWTWLGRAGARRASADATDTREDA